MTALQGIDDMITLNNMTEESMLKNLQVRYAKDVIYVRAILGRELCSFPDRWRADLYRHYPRVCKPVPGAPNLQPRHCQEMYDDNAVWLSFPSRSPLPWSHDLMPSGKYLWRVCRRWPVFPSLYPSPSSCFRG